MRKILMFVIVAPICAFAQRNDSVPRGEQAPRLILKWSPLHLMINRFPSVQLAAEYRISEYTSIQVDGGPIVQLDRASDVTPEYFNMRGFKLKTEVRYYLTRINGGWRYYLAPEIYYNHIDYNKSDTYGYNCADGDCDYYRHVTYKMKYRDSGLNFKFGGMATFGRFCLDYHVGLAARFIRYTPVGKPDGTSTDDLGFDESWFDFNDEETRNVVQPTTGIRVGFVLK